MPANCRRPPYRHGTTRRIILHQTYQKTPTSGGKRKLKGYACRARKSTNPGWVRFKHHSKNVGTAIFMPNKKTVQEYLSKGYTVESVH
jgi:hypothetical protein